MQEKIDAIRKESERLMNEGGGGHDWLHVLRAYKLAKLIGEKEGADLAVVEPAALMHDLGRGREEGKEIHATASARIAKQILERVGYPPSLRQPVLDAIANHSWRCPAESLETKVLQDADKLDALGAVGVMRCFVYGGTEGREDYCEEDAFCASREPDDARYSLDHFYAKLSKLEMHTEAGKALAKERKKYLEDFLEQLRKEIV